MGGIEKNFRARNRKANIQRAVLASVAVTGILAIAVVAPNAVQLLKHLDPRRRKYDPKYTASKTLNRLIDKGYLNKEGKFVRLTHGGERYLRRLEINDFKFKKPKKWDKKFRVIIFDIKESRRNVREQFRRTLTQIGFYKLQKSVWVFPYDCEDIIALLKASHEIGYDIIYMIADSIEGEYRIKKFFNLH